MIGFRTYSDLLASLDGTSDRRTLGYAPNGDPIVVYKTGGNRGPPVLVTAGSHATEHAGVGAAVELVKALDRVDDAGHAVYIVPSRDPIGLNGYSATLASALGRAVDFDSFEELETLLRSEGEIVYDGDILLTLIGDTGFASARPGELSSSLRLLTTLKGFQETHPDVLAAFAGRRIYAPAGHTSVEATGDFERAYTLVVSPTGELLHLNRFFDRTWAPVETRCVRNLLREIEPGMLFDLHESSRQEDRFHLSMRPIRTEESHRWEARVADAIVESVSDAGTDLATDEDVLDSGLDVIGHDDRKQSNAAFYSRYRQGAYWVDPNVTDPPRRGEGLNATDKAATTESLAFTIETGMGDTLNNRIETTIRSVRAGIARYADRFR